MSTNGFSNLAFNKVGLLEEDVPTLDLMSDQLSQAGLGVITFPDKHAAVESAKNPDNPLVYIFDINIGDDRQQEGLDAAESIKGINENAIVIIYSGYPDRYARMAERVRADFFKAKTSNPRADLHEILLQILLAAIKRIEKQISKLSRDGEEINNPILNYYLNVIFEKIEQCLVSAQTPTTDKYDIFTINATYDVILEFLSKNFAHIEEHTIPSKNFIESFLFDLFNSLIIQLRNQDSVKLGKMGELRKENHMLIFHPSRELLNELDI